jgi:hypothetical protein
MADFAHQPGVGGTNLQFPVKGHRHVVTVSRPLGDGDFPPQTTMPDGQGRTTVKSFPDGRPMVRMVVPVLVRPDATHPDGHATLSVQGQMAEALKQAMALVGAGHLNGIPEDHSVIDVEFYDERPPKRAGHNAQKLYRVSYQRPPGAAQADGQQALAAPNGNGNGQQAPAPAQPPYQVPPAPAQYQPPQAPQAPYQPPAPQAPYQPPAAPPVPAYGQVAPGQPVSQPAQGYPQQLIGQLQPPAPVQFQPPVPPQGMMSPGQQVDYAAQQGLQAAQAAAPQPPVQQQGQPMAPPPNANPATQAALAQLLGQPLPLPQ